MALSPDGNTLAFGHDHVIQLMDTDSWRPTDRFTAAMSVDALAFAPDGKTLLTNIAKISLGKDKTYRHETGNYPGVAFTADGGVVVKSGRLDRGPHLFRPSGDRIRFFDLRLHGGPVAAAPLGKSLAGAKPSVRNVILFELTSGEPRRWFTTQQPVEALTFSPDARVLAAAEGDAVVLWDVETERELIRFQGHTGRITALAFAPDGKTLASGGLDSTVLLWDLDDKPKSPQRKPVEMSAEAMQICWLELIDEDAAFAYPVMERLIRAGDPAVHFLRERMALPPGLVHKPISDNEAPPPAFLRWTRALEALEFIGTPEARKLVAELARGPEQSPTAREARAALARLQQRR